jgi:hypothetical protein
MNQLIAVLNEYLGKKAPQLPAAFKEFLVRFAPYLCILGILASLSALGYLGGVGVYGVGNLTVSWRHYADIAWIGGVACIVLSCLALPGLFKPSSRGWTMLFYGLLVHVVMCCLYFSGGGLVGAAIAAYFLFQIRPYYFGEAVLAPSAPVPPPSQPPSDNPPKAG